MKEKAIKRINKLGKIGGIVAKIARIFMIVGAAALLIGGIILMCVPKDFLNITVSGKMGMEINVGKYFETGSPAGMEKQCFFMDFSGFACIFPQKQLY